MKHDVAQRILETRRRLLLEGKRDTMNNVIERIGGSKSTLKKYWASTYPADHPMQAIEASAAAIAVAAEPEFTLENLRAYYTNRYTSPWPQGMLPPLEAYPLLNQLWKEYDAQVAAAEREKYVVLNQLGQLRGVVDDTPLRQVEAKRSTAALLCHSIESDRDLIRYKAYREGQPLPE